MHTRGLRFQMQSYSKRRRGTSRRKQLNHLNNSLMIDGVAALMYVKSDNTRFRTGDGDAKKEENNGTMGVRRRRGPKRTGEFKGNKPFISLVVGIF